MKKSLLIIGCSLLTMQVFSQSDISGGVVGHQRLPGRYVGWSPTAPGSVSGSLDVRNDFNDKINFSTNGSKRMLINNGTIFPTDGMIAIGNNLANTFIPLDRFHLHQTSGNVAIRYTTDIIGGVGTGATGSDGYSTGITNNGFVFYTQLERQPMVWSLRDSVGNNIHERFRIEPNTGRIGINNPNPMWQVDINTDNIGAGTGAPSYRDNFYLRARQEETPLCHIALINASGGQGTCTPTLWGNVDNVGSPYNTALLTVGNTTDLGDAVAANPVTIFMSGKNWGPNDPANLSPIESMTPVKNRQIFGWYNGNERMMTMRANGYLGVRTLNPITRVTINADTIAATLDAQGNPVWTTTATGPTTPNAHAGADATKGAIATGISGLAFADLTTASNPILKNPHNVPAVLTVDKDGKVILVKDGGAGTSAAYNGTSVDPATQKVQLGQDVPVNGINTAALINDREIPMGGNNVLFSDDGMIGVGNIFTAGNVLPNAKMDIQGNSVNPIVFNAAINSTAVSGTYRMSTFFNRSNNAVKSSTVYAFAGHSTKTSIAFEGEASTTVGGDNIGILTTTLGGKTNTGGNLNARGGSSNANIGVSGSGWESNLTNYGGSFQGGNPGVTNGIQNYGVYTIALGGKNAYGIYANATGGAIQNWSGWFNGNTSVAGTVFSTSDESLKQNIEPVSNALQQIKNIQASTFEFDTATYTPQGLNLPSGLQYGFVAQNVQSQFPELVKATTKPAEYDTLGNISKPEVTFLAMNYDGMIPIAVGAIQELSHDHDSLKTVVDGLAASSASTRAENGLGIENDKAVLGGAAGSGNGALLNDREVPMENNNLTFTSSPAGSFNEAKNRVGIGTSLPAGILHVECSKPFENAAKAVRIVNTSAITKSNSAYGIDLSMNNTFTNDGVGSEGYSYGLMMNINSPDINTNAVGIRIDPNGGNVSHGVDVYIGKGATNNIAYVASVNSLNANTGTSSTGYWSSVNTNGGLLNFGVRSTAQNAAYNFGGHFTAQNGQNNFGILATAPLNGSNYAAFFDGDVQVVTGNLYTPGGVVLSGSDANLKTNIAALGNTSEIIRELLPKTFNYDTTKYFITDGKKQYGLIAQDVENVLPELVNEFTVPDKRDTAGNVIANGGTYKSLNYNAFIAILIANAKEQQAIIDSLKAANNTRMDALEAMMQQCCANTATRKAGEETKAQPNVIDVELSDKNTIVLNQNVPNPFAEQTSIAYNIPANTGFAQILIYNTNGQLIKAVDIKEKGQGRLNVFANDLSSGAYTYSLFVDGKLIDTKKMIKE